MLWTIFIVGIIGLLLVDNLVLRKKSHADSVKTAAKETIFWVLLALSFSVAIYFIYKSELTPNVNNLTPSQAVMKYISGYLIELTLSVDNLFVIALIFAAQNIPTDKQHRVLFWGILGAIVFRAIFIFIGVALINAISWMTYVFGAFLLFTALKMLVKKGEDESQSGLSNKLKKHIRVTDEMFGEKFFVRKDGIRYATPLFLALVLIEFTDILFAVDSIPAILAVTTDPFLVFTSNIFAILGLRSMYFFLADMLQKFKYLKYSVIVILIFVSFKLILIDFVHLKEWVSLVFISLAIAGGIIYSKLQDKKNND